MSGYVYQDLDSVEPVSDTFGEQAANAGLYNVISGCAPAYDAGDMTVDCAAGAIMHYGTPIQVSAQANCWTLVSDPTYPRWTWLYLDSSGVAGQVNGDPAATPAVPELGDNVAVALVYVQATLTIAANASYKLDKRVPNPAGLIGYSGTATATTSTAAVDLVTISKLGFSDSIPTTVPLRIVFNYRKTATAAQAVGFGLKVNSTVVQEASVSTGRIRTSAANQVENGMAEILIGPRSTANYLSGFAAMFSTYTTVSLTAGSLMDAANATAPASLDAQLPNAAITSLAIRAINGTSNNNAEVTAVFVYQN